MDKDFQNILNRLYNHARLSPQIPITEETYILAIESVFNMVVITDKQGIVLYANPAVERITGFSREEVVGKNVRLWGGMMKNSFYENLWKTILHGKIFKGEIQNHRKNGDPYTARLTISPILKNKKVIGFVGTEEDITLEKRLQKEKEEFISLASHQLRTPLGAMKWNLELLADTYPKMKNELSKLAVQNEYMIDLVNRLLVVLRIGDNRLVVKPEKTVLDDFLRSTVSHFQIKLNKTGVSLTVENKLKNVPVSTDLLMLKEIIFNLLDNAIKFSKNKGAIILKTGKTAANWYVSIKDSGMGIPQNEIPHILTKFTRGSNTVSIPGTGLGMFIVNTYVEKLKGKIRIKSAINKGTEITCLFSL